MIHVCSLLLLETWEAVDIMNSVKYPNLKKYSKLTKHLKLPTTLTAAWPHLLQHKFPTLQKSQSTLAYRIKTFQQKTNKPTKTSWDKDQKRIPKLFSEHNISGDRVTAVSLFADHTEIHGKCTQKGWFSLGSKPWSISSMTAGSILYNSNKITNWRPEKINETSM